MNQAETIMAVQRMQDYIEGHLCEEVTMKQLSKAAGYSPWHAARMFREITGKAPFEYIRSMRLTRAALALRDEGPKIIDVALDFVFDSHEGFTRAFSKEFGISPVRYRKTSPPIQLFLPQKVFDVYRAIQKGERRMKEMSDKKETKAIFVQIIERPARKVLLKRGVKAEDYFKYCEEVGCDVWPLLTSVKEALYEPVGMWLPKHLVREGTSKYVQGVELPQDYSNEVPEGYELIDLPPCKMMVFQGEPYDEEDFMEAIEEVWQHIEKFDPTVYGYKWDPEAAPRFQLAPMGYRGYIEALPVAPIK
jgi:AraC family transcriptional regulator